MKKYALYDKNGFQGMVFGKETDAKVAIHNSDLNFKEVNLSFNEALQSVDSDGIVFDRSEDDIVYRKHKLRKHDKTMENYDTLIKERVAELVLTPEEFKEYSSIKNIKKELYKKDKKDK